MRFVCSELLFDSDAGIDRYDIAAVAEQRVEVHLEDLGGSLNQS